MLLAMRPDKMTTNKTHCYGTYCKTVSPNGDYNSDSCAIFNDLSLSDTTEAEIRKE